jgi:hypothetical protein
MGISDNKGFSFNISLRQVGALVLAFALCMVAIYWNALTIGYVVVTLALCAFFLAVAFDLGLTRKPGSELPEATPEMPADEAPAARRRGGRNARTA